jgi:hypothetical protein
MELCASGARGYRYQSFSTTLLLAKRQNEYSISILRFGQSIFLQQLATPQTWRGSVLFRFLPNRAGCLLGSNLTRIYLVMS